MMRTPRFSGAIAMQIRAVALLVLIGLALPAPAPAQAPEDMTGTVLVTIKGILAPDEKTANDVGWGGISLGFTGDNVNTTRWLGVVHASTFGGDSFAAKTAVFKSHYTPSLFIVGPPGLVKQLLAIPNGSRVHLEGAIELGSRNMMLDLVRPLPGN
jgi:hypothetical protein